MPLPLSLASLSATSGIVHSPLPTRAQATWWEALPLSLPHPLP
jgi:hypothetical protein